MAASLPSFQDEKFVMRRSTFRLLMDEVQKRNGDQGQGNNVSAYSYLESQETFAHFKVIWFCRVGLHNRRCQCKRKHAPSQRR